ncbi:MAG: CBS domain-containing protein [candidate division NC10 bacterium]|nr:CBS domain-containing protein [candidate division NC10 bacterium]
MSSIMNKKVVALRPEDKVAKAAKFMRERGVGCILVLDEEKRPLGILTDRDIVVSVLARGLDPKATRLKQVMTPNVVVAKEDEILLRAARAMAEARIRRLPIVDGKGRVVGIVSVDDILVVLITELSNVCSAIVGPSKLL